MVVNTLDDSVSVIEDDSGNQDENRPDRSQPEQTDPPLRQSTRIKSVPGWMRTGDYIMHSAHAVTRGWTTKAQLAVQLSSYCQEPHEGSLVFDFLKS